MVNRKVYAFKKKTWKISIHILTVTRCIHNSILHFVKCSQLQIMHEIKSKYSSIHWKCNIPITSRQFIT